MKTMLVSVDFSAATRGVIDAAVELAAASKAKVILHHSLISPMVTTEYGLGVEMLQEAMVVNEKAARHQLEHLEDELTARGLDVTTLLSHGVPSATILEVATKRHVDMIVLGSHGHTAFFEFLLGGTTHDVLKKATCPVLIVPRAATKPDSKKVKQAKKARK